MPLPSSYTIKIPEGVNGTAFVMVTSHSDALNYARTAVDDKAIVAGPMGIVLGWFFLNFVCNNKNCFLT